MTPGRDQVGEEAIDVGRVLTEKGEGGSGLPPVGGCQSENDITLASVSSITLSSPGPAASA